MILIDVQYLQNVVFSFEKGLSGQGHSSDLNHPIKKLPSRIPNMTTGGISPPFEKSWTSLVPSLPSENETLVIAVERHVKVDIKLFLFYPFLLDFSIFSSKCFVRHCLSKQIYGHNLTKSLLNFNLLTFSMTLKRFFYL